MARQTGGRGRTASKIVRPLPALAHEQIVAETDETIVAIEVITQPIPVQLPLVIVPDKIRDIPVAVIIHKKYIARLLRHRLLKIILRLNRIRHIKCPDARYQVIYSCLRIMLMALAIAVTAATLH